MRRVLLILPLLLSVPGLAVAAPAGYGARHLSRRNVGLEQLQARRRGEMRRVREQMQKMAQWRKLDSDAAAKKAGYDSLAALREAIPKIEDSLVSSAHELRLQGQEGAKLFAEVVETLGAPRSQKERRAISAKLQEKGLQAADEPYYPLSRLAELKKRVMDSTTLLTQRDRRGLLGEIDDAALRVVVGSKRYREQLGVAKAKLQEGKDKLAQGAVYALHPLLQARHALDAIKRVDSFVPEDIKSRWVSPTFGSKHEKVFTFELYPDPPREVRTMREQLLPLQRRAAVSGLRYVNGRFARGQVVEGKKALEWFRPHVSRMKELQRLLVYVEAHEKRRGDAVTAKRLSSLRQRFDRLSAELRGAMRDPRLGKADFVAQLSRLYVESYDAALLGRGAELGKQVHAELVQAAEAGKNHIYQLNDTIRRAERKGDLYAGFVAANAMAREVEQMAAALEPHHRRSTPIYRLYADLMALKNPVADMERKRAQLLEAEAKKAISGAWAAIRQGDALAGAQQAKAWGDAFAEQPERPDQLRLLKKARLLRRLGERAPGRRAKAIARLIDGLKRQAAGGDVQGARNRAEALRQRAARYADLPERKRLLHAIDTLIGDLWREEQRIAEEQAREQRRRQRVEAHRPAHKALAILRQVKRLLANDKVDDALAKLDLDALRKVGAHRALVARRERLLRTRVVQRKAEQLVARAERLLVERQGGQARKLAQEAQYLADVHRVDLDAAPLRRGADSAHPLGRPSLVRRVRRILEATRPLKLNPAVAQAFRDLGLDPNDPLQASYEQAERAFRAVMKETGFIRKGQTAGLPPEIVKLAQDKAIRAQKAWRDVIRRQLKPR